MISYSLDDNKKTALYEQLYNYLKNDIVSGRLSANTPLPSKRNFAGQLSISVITVENAYNQLLSEGFIYSLPRKGFYVNDIFEDNPLSQNQIMSTTNNADKANQNANYTHNSTPATQYFMSTDNNHTIPTDKYFADFSSNATDPESFPFSIWVKLTRRILSEDQAYLMQNSPSNGIPELRQAIANYLYAFRGMNVNPDNIIIGAGTETMYNILIQLLGYDKIYACENPGYDKISQILSSNNVKSLRIPIDESGVIVSELEKHLVNIIHTTPSHHFPTGLTMPIKRRYELLSWADNDQKDTRYIIEDDYDSEFRLAGRPVPSLFSTDNNSKVIYMNTFTKSLASTIRISYMILPDNLMEFYRKNLFFYSCTVSTFEQLTLARFISEGYYEKHINRMRNASRKKRDLLLNSIKNSPLGDISEISEEKSGLHFVLNIKTRMSENELITKCKENSIKLMPISYFYKDKKTANKNAYMINYSSIPTERIEESVNRICNSIA